jgi:hypothetical protein
VLATRVLDTRATSALQANQKVSLSLAALGVSAVPGGVTATFTLVGPSSTGTLSVSPCGGAEVKAPFTNAPLSAFSLVVPVGSNGMCIVPSVSTHVVVDIHGAWESGAPSIVPVVPVRVLGTSTAGAPIDLTPIPVTIAGAGGLPATVTSTLLQITLVGASRPASVFVWPCDQARPAAAVGVVAASRTTTFAVTAAVTNGQVCVATTDVAAVFVDVSGVN